MNSFREFLEFAEHFSVIVEAKLGVYGKSEDKTIKDEIAEEAEVIFNQYAAYAKNTETKSGGLNWLSINYAHWTAPENKAKMIQMIKNRLAKVVYPGYPKGHGRIVGRNFVRSEWQKDVGYGGRRFAQYAGGKGYTLPMIHPEYPGTIGLTEPLLKSRGPGRQLVNPELGPKKKPLQPERFRRKDLPPHGRYPSGKIRPEFHIKRKKKGEEEEASPWTPWTWGPGSGI